MTGIPYCDDPWSLIVPNLWVGGSVYISPTEQLRPVLVTDEFDAVYTFTGQAGLGPADGVHHIHYRFPDDELDDEHLTVIHHLVDHVVADLEQGRKVLLRCRAGYNRSALVAGFTLLRRGLNADEAVALLRKQRSKYTLCNTHFVGYLQAADADVEPDEEMCHGA